MLGGVYADMVTRRTYLQSFGGIAAGAMGGAALTENEKCDVDLAFQHDDDPEPIPPAELPDDLEDSVQRVQGNLPNWTDMVNGRFRRDDIGDVLASETPIIDIYACDDDEEHTYTADISVETLGDGKFSSINTYLEEDDEETLREELGRTFSEYLPQTMYQLAEYRPTVESSEKSTITNIDFTVKAVDGGTMNVSLDAEGMDEAYRASERVDTNVTREESYRVAMNRLEMEKTPPLDPY